MKTAKELWDYIKSGDLKLQHEFHEVNEGDEWYSEYGEICRIWFPDKTCIECGFIQIRECEDDWAQAESYTAFRCMDISDPDSDSYMRTLKIDFVYNKLQS
jgi:hypothetical protein